MANEQEQGQILPEDVQKEAAIPTPTLQEMQQRVDVFSDVVARAENNKTTIEQGTLTARPELDLSQVPTDNVRRLDVLVTLNDRHKTLTERTIPYFTRVRDEWRDRYLNALDERVEQVRKGTEAGRLPQVELARAQDIYVAERDRLGAGPVPVPVKEPVPSTQGEPQAVQPEAQAEVSEREYELLRYLDRGAWHELALMAIEDEGDYHTLTDLASQVGVQLLASYFNQRYGDEGDKSPARIRIERLRDMLGDNPDNPRIISRTGERRGTRYVFSPLTNPKLVPRKKTSSPDVADQGEANPLPEDQPNPDVLTGDESAELARIILRYEGTPIRFEDGLESSFDFDENIKKHLVEAVGDQQENIPEEDRRKTLEADLQLLDKLKHITTDETQNLRDQQSDASIELVDEIEAYDIDGMDGYLHDFLRDMIQQELDHTTDTESIAYERFWKGPDELLDYLTGTQPSPEEPPHGNNPDIPIPSPEDAEVEKLRARLEPYVDEVSQAFASQLGSNGPIALRDVRSKYWDLRSTIDWATKANKFVPVELVNQRAAVDLARVALFRFLQDLRANQPPQKKIRTFDTNRYLSVIEKLLQEKRDSSS